MKTIFLNAKICLNSDDEMEKVFEITIEDGVVTDDTWKFQVADKIADRYVDSGQVCINGVSILDAAPSDVTPISL